MSTTTSTPYDWIRKIPISLASLDEIPLVGSPPQFPWDSFTKSLSQTLEIQDLHFEPSEFQWRDNGDLFSGLGSPLIPLNFSTTPLDGGLCWAIAEEELKKLMNAVLMKDSEPFPVPATEFLDGFHHFLALECLRAIQESSFDPDLDPQIMKNGSVPKGPMLTCDVTITLGKNKIVGRLFLSPELTKSARKHYVRKGEKAIYNSPLAEKIDLTLHIEAGSTSIKMQEWSQVKPGDFLLLDKCGIGAGEKKGDVMLTLQGHPFFRAALKDGTIKILEHPLYYEVGQTMNKSEDNEKDYDEEDEDEEEEEDEDEEVEDEEEEEDEDEEVEDEEEEDDDEEDEDEEEEEEEPVVQKKEKKEKEEKGEIVAPSKAHLVSEKDEKKAPSAQDIPVSVIIEVGRLQMTVKTLMELKPGNLLELNVHPESGIDLVVNGSRVGKGELMQIGDTLGVRVLELG